MNSTALICGIKYRVTDVIVILTLCQQALYLACLPRVTSHTLQTSDDRKFVCCSQATNTVTHRLYWFPPKKYKFAIPLTRVLARRLNNLFTSLLNRNPSISSESEGERQLPPSLPPPFAGQKTDHRMLFSTRIVSFKFRQIPLRPSQGKQNIQAKRPIEPQTFKKSPLSDLHS